MDSNIAVITLNPSIDKTITIDRLIPYGLNRVKSSRLDPGGKGVNVARVLKNFGADVKICGLVAGETGKRLISFLDQAKIKNDFLQIEGETRTNLKIFDQSVNKMTEINEAGVFVDADSETRFLDQYKSLISGVSIVVLSGSLPPGISADFYAECITIAKTQGIKTLFDADGDALKKGLAAVPYAIKPNVHELEMLTGQTFQDYQAIVNAANRIIDTGVEIVIVSMGPDGAIVAGKGEAYKVDSWDIPVKSTVGAGDSMVGALAFSVERNDSLFDIAKITTAAGTITASKAGTQICTMDEVERSLEKVAVHKIS